MYDCILMYQKHLCKASSVKLSYCLSYIFHAEAQISHALLKDSSSLPAKEVYRDQ